MLRSRRFAVSSLWPAGLAVWLWACDPESPPRPVDEGFLTLDSTLVIDAFHFSTAACNEVLPAGYRNIDKIDTADSVWVYVNSTACYATHIAIEDSTGKKIRTLDRHFGIPGRKDGEKERGEPGYLGWDAKDDRGLPVTGKRYLWRMEFDFGGGRIRKYRADMLL